MGRILIAGTGGGCGKTTVSCAVLGALKNRNINITGFKCGPDYLDPSFQREIIGIHAYNIDSFMMSENTIKYLVGSHSDGIAVIDGVKGCYDGYRLTEKASTNEIALITKTPTLLVLDCSDTEGSPGAVLYGFLKYKKNMIRGVIFNRMDPADYGLYRGLCESMNIRCYGYIPTLKQVVSENKNLSIVTELEISAFRKQMDELALIAEKSVDIDGIAELAGEAKDLSCKKINIPYVGKARIAVARDKAFCVNYEENFDILKKMGAELVTFSPLNDEKLPEGIDGLMFGGAFLELNAERLSKNKSMLGSVKETIEGGIPVIAESGGFVYLHKHIQDITGMIYDMAGVIDGSCTRVYPINNYGYIEVYAQEDNLLLEKGDRIKTYEFHRYESNVPGSDMIVSKNGEMRRSIHANDTMYAGFPHLNFYSDVKMAERFMRACIK